MRKKELIKKLEERCDKCISLEENIIKLNDINNELNLKYMTLLTKYNKLLKSVLETDTQNIIYNNNLYEITEVNYYQKEGQVDSIEITAHKIPKKEGLINNMSKIFREAYDNINETLFGNKK